VLAVAAAGATAREARPPVPIAYVEANGLYSA
jgi:hypothetical protein